MSRNSEQCTAAGNLLDDIPDAMPRELVDTLTEAAGLRIERIVSWGHVTEPGSWYDQPWPEWVLLIQGDATLRIERAGLRQLNPGGWMMLPAHCRHRIEATSSNPPAIWLAIHFQGE